MVQAANAPRKPGFDAPDGSGLDVSALDFKIETPIDGDILICYASTASKGLKFDQLHLNMHLRILHFDYSI